MKDHFYQGRKLPHWMPEQGTFFITTRLYGSIPKNVIQKLKSDYNLALSNLNSKILHTKDAHLDATSDTKRTIDYLRKKLKYEADMQYFEQFDNYLEKCLNEPHWLKQPLIADFNAKNIHFYAEKYFDLWAYSIMSNHLHLVLTLYPDAPVLWKVLQDMKKYSATQCNQMLGRSGPFWEKESYDHLIRNTNGEFYKIVNYTMNNPVKAGIVSDWRAHPWTYCNPVLLE